nr:immunoglobulin heavy chain junction region [Macaca mulatta]
CANAIVGATGGHYYW